MFNRFYTAYDMLDNFICCADTITQLADSLGVSRRTIQRAIKASLAYGSGDKPRGYKSAPDLLYFAGCVTSFGETKIFCYDATNW